MLDITPRINGVFMDLSNPELRLVRTLEELSCELDGEIAILNLKSKLYFGLTDVSAMIWRALETPQSFDEIVAAVTTQYDVDAEQCREDLGVFLSILKERGLVEIGEAA